MDSLTSILSNQLKCALTKLNLQNCHISEQGASKLVAALCKNTTLEDLNLSHNLVNVEGATAVAKMLAMNRTLTVLHLEDCHISGQGASELASALSKNSTQKYLDLYHNPIGVEGASSMSVMLQHNTSMEYTFISVHDSSGKQGVHHLIRSLKHNHTLRILGLPKKYQSETSDHRIIWQPTPHMYIPQDVYFIMYTYWNVICSFIGNKPQ